jgi:hypothetical protein
MNTTPTKLSIIFSGEDLTATLLDNTSTPVRVRAMPARHLGRVLQLADKEAELLEFVCLIPSTSPEGEVISGWRAVPPGWADNLGDGSHATLYEAAKRLNFSRAATWAERQIAAKQFSGELALKAEEVLMPLMEQIVGSLALLSKPSAAPVPGAVTRS